MTTSSPKSFNYLALRGANVDDMEFVEQFKLPADVAYTDKINDAMLDLTEKENIRSYMDDDNMDAEQAAMKAAEMKANSRKDLNMLLARKGMLN